MIYFNEMLWQTIVTSLYLFLPAYAANMAPVIAARLNLFPSLALPLDGGRRVGATPLFGPHKTVRGIVVGILAGVGTAVLQEFLAVWSVFFRDLTQFPFDTESSILWGVVLGGGALLGDLVKSAIKRRLRIPPGSRWFPWDQLDMAIGGLLGGALLYSLSWQTVLTVLLLTPFIGLLVNAGSYLLKIKEAW